MREVHEPLILSVSGPDRPGILAELAGILARGQIDLVDVEQATLQNFLALSLLVDLGNRPERAQVILREFLPAAARMGLNAEVRAISHPELRILKEQDLWAVTLIGEAAIAHMVTTVAAATARHNANIVTIRRLAEQDISAAELIVDVSRTAYVDSFRRDLLSACEAVGMDVGVAPEDVHRKSKRVVVMDADSTLVAGEVIDELARRAGVVEKVAAITRRAMEGELDFTAALTERVALLAGLGRADLQAVIDSMRLTPGAAETIAVLKALGFKVGVISGGFTFFTDHLRTTLGLDYAFGNVLEMEGDRLTGRVVPPVIDAQGKAERVRQIARELGVPLSQVVTVGDGANDIPMLETAGLGIAFRAKEAARRAARGTIQRNDMKALLYLLGISQRDVRRVARRDPP